MPASSDVVLFGTGVAPLVAAYRLIIEGRSVLLINPMADFFQEDTEMDFDPFWPPTLKNLATQRIQKSLAESVFEEIRNDYPGPIEPWPDQKMGYRDPSAPHVRARTRVWLQSLDPIYREKNTHQWSAVEDMYVKVSDAGLNPLIHEGLTALRKVPGVSKKAESPENLKAIAVPNIADFDVSRYRDGLLEFVRERLGPDNFVVGAGRVELTEGGIRFTTSSGPRTMRLNDGMVVFWSPRMTPWIEALAKREEWKIPEPKGIRIWEQWSLVSKEKLDPGVIAQIEDTYVWAEAEGAPQFDGQGLLRLAVLRSGPVVSHEDYMRVSSLVGTDSFQALHRLCNDVLRWEEFSIRSMKHQPVLEWDFKHPDKSFTWIEGAPIRLGLVCGCDGPLFDVIRVARVACEKLAGLK